MDLMIAYWPVALVAALVALLLLYLLLRPRQRVTLTDSAPVRPHMTAKPATIASQEDLPATKTPVAARPVTAARIPLQSTADRSDDNLTQLKGIGPKLAVVLNDRGFARFDQLANLSPGQIAELDESLGAFRGRLARDKVVEQAAYLARGDIEGFEQRFGKL